VRRICREDGSWSQVDASNCSDLVISELATLANPVETMSFDHMLGILTERVDTNTATFGSIDVRNTFLILVGALTNVDTISSATTQALLDVLGRLMEVSDKSIKKGLAWPGVTSRVNAVVTTLINMSSVSAQQLQSDNKALRILKQSYSTATVSHAKMGVDYFGKSFQIAVPLQPFQDVNEGSASVQFAFFNSTNLFSRPVKATQDREGPSFSMTLTNWPNGVPFSGRVEYTLPIIVRPGPSQVCASWSLLDGWRSDNCVSTGHPSAGITTCSCAVRDTVFGVMNWKRSLNISRNISFDTTQAPDGGIAGGSANGSIAETSTNLLWLSVAVLVLTIGVLVWLKRVRDNVTVSPMINLSLTAALTHIAMVVGLDKRGSECHVWAGIIHYFALVSFCWLMINVREVYLQLKKRHTPGARQLQLSIAVYVAPIVLVWMGADAFGPNYNPDSQQCWSRGEHFWGVWVLPNVAMVIMSVGYILAILLHTPDDYVSSIVRSSKKVSNQVIAVIMVIVVFVTECFWVLASIQALVGVNNILHSVASVFAIIQSIGIMVYCVYMCIESKRCDEEEAQRNQLQQVHGVGLSPVAGSRPSVHWDDSTLVSPREKDSALRGRGKKPRMTLRHPSDDLSQDDQSMARWQPDTLDVDVLHSAMFSTVKLREQDSELFGSFDDSEVNPRGSYISMGNSVGHSNESSSDVQYPEGKTPTGSLSRNVLPNMWGGVKGNPLFGNPDGNGNWGGTDNDTDTDDVVDDDILSLPPLRPSAPAELDNLEEADLSRISRNPPAMPTMPIENTTGVSRIDAMHLTPHHTHGMKVDSNDDDDHDDDDRDVGLESPNHEEVDGTLPPTPSPSPSTGSCLSLSLPPSPENDVDLEED